MLWYLFGFAVGAGVLGALWFLLRKLDVRFTWRGTEWMVGLLLAALLAGCVFAPDENAPVGAAPRGRPETAPRGRPETAFRGRPDALPVGRQEMVTNDDGQARGPAPTGSAANPIYFRAPVLEALLTQAVAVSAVPKPQDPKPQNPVVSTVPKPQDPKAKAPAGSLWGAYFWRRAGFDLGVACGAAAFVAAWWFFLKRSA